MMTVLSQDQRQKQQDIVAHNKQFSEDGCAVKSCATIVPSPRHTCTVIMLCNQHLAMPHLSGGWMSLAKEKCSYKV